MSLATRCTSCGTVFRVVQDQLKVSEGWVRCGRCNEVFNALEGLFDLERDPPAQWTTAAGPTSAAPAPGTASVAFDAGPEELHDPSLVDKIDAQLLSPRRSGFGALATLAPAERRHEDFADARFDTDLPPEGHSDLSIIEPPTTQTEPAAEDEGPSTPDFVRQADGQARWRGSAARGWLFAACLLLAAGLVVQVGHQFRDRIAAQWPSLRPVMLSWCGLVGCRIEAPRRIEDVSVESTALTRSPAPADAFVLSVVLRNRSNLPLSVPWIDLALTDANGLLVARRALAPKDFNVDPRPLAPASELPMQLTLSAGAGRVSGYTVEVFYP